MGTLIDDCESNYFACMLEDFLNVAGETVNLYSMIATSPDADPYYDIVYDEPTVEAISGDEEFKFIGPYSMVAVVSKGSKSVSLEERGTRIERSDGYVWFARSVIEREGYPAPKRGDIIEWQGRYYDIIKVSTGGELGNTLTFTKYTCELKINYSFKPERRLAGDDVAAL